MKQEKKFANSKSGGGGILNRNAFTLIELLAIIVILAIIAVITVPIILNVIENSRKGAATDSAYGYKDAVNKAYIQELAKPNNGSLKLNGTYLVQSDGTLNADTGSNFGVTNYTNLPVSVSGDKPTSGKLKYSNNVLNAGCLVIGDYKVTFDGNTATTVKGNCEDYEFTSENAQGGSSSNEQGNGGNQQVTNPYETTFNGNYTYTSFNSFEDDGEGGFVPVEFNNEWNVFLRNDGTTPEVCTVFSSGTVCMTSSYYNSSYSEVGNYEVDFEDVTDGAYVITTTAELQATELKGYSLAKAEEMLNKGASYCDVYGNNWICHMASSVSCTIYTLDLDGSVSCDYGRNSCGVDNNGSVYCSSN